MLPVRAERDMDEGEEKVLTDGKYCLQRSEVT
jgi:hypothetical protein